MKSDIPERIGILDAITAGLTQASKRPWLILFPATVDLSLWLAPQVAIGKLLQSLLAIWEALVRAAYSPAQLATMSGMFAMVRDTMAALGAQVNLAETLTGGWLNPPSALVADQSSRLTFFSDIILAPVGLSLPLTRVAPPPWRPAAIEVASLWTVLLLLGGLWLLGQVWTALYLRSAAMGYKSSASGETKGRPASAGAPARRDEEPTPPPAEDTRPANRNANPAADGQQPGDASFLALLARLVALSFLLGLAVLALRLPLGVAASMMLLSGGSGANVMFMLVGGMTLWLLVGFLTSSFFVGEVILLERQPLWRSIVQSLTLVRSSGFATTGLALVINLIVIGFRAVWGLIGGTPTGAVTGILANAYLSTAMLLAVFTFYDSLKGRWQALVAKAQAQQARQMKNNGQ